MFHFCIEFEVFPNIFLNFIFEYVEHYYTSKSSYSTKLHTRRNVTPSFLLLPLLGKQCDCTLILPIFLYAKIIRFICMFVFSFLSYTKGSIVCTIFTVFLQKLNVTIDWILPSALSVLWSYNTLWVSWAKKMPQVPQGFA